MLARLHFGTVFCIVLQCVAVCCSVLQCVAVCCSALQQQFIVCLPTTHHVLSHHGSIVPRPASQSAAARAAAPFAAVEASWKETALYVRSVLQCVAVCCRVSTGACTFCGGPNTKEADCIVQYSRQYTCNTLQHMVLHSALYNTMQQTTCSVLQCVTVCCSVLQSAAECCNVILRGVVCCSMFAARKRALRAL